MNYTINISLPKQLADMAKQQVKKGFYSSMSEVVREALRNFLKEEIPTYKMSKKAERIAEKAMEEYRAGKTRKIQSLDELDSL